MQCYGYSRNWWGRPEVYCPARREGFQCDLFNPGSLWALLSKSEGRHPHCWCALASVPWVARIMKATWLWILLGFNLTWGCQVFVYPTVVHFIYNACPGIHYTPLRVHRHMHNLTQIPWKQTSHSTTSGGMWFVRKSCWWQYCWQQAFVRKKKISTGECILHISIRFTFPPYIHHWDKTILAFANQKMTYSLQTYTRSSCLQK